MSGDEAVDWRARHRDLTRRLGFGDDITEPQADNDTIVKWFDQQGSDASEWVESQLWRQDCYLKGHDEMEDCWECDPRLRLDAAEAKLARVEAERDRWQSCAEAEAEVTLNLTAALARVEALVTAAEHATVTSLARTFDGTPSPVTIPADHLRAALNPEAT